MLDTSNYVQVTHYVDHQSLRTYSYDIVKSTDGGSTKQLLVSDILPKDLPINDTGLPLSSFVLPSRDSTGDFQTQGWLGFYGAAPSGQPAVTGFIAGNSALQSLISALATVGLVRNDTMPADVVQLIGDLGGDAVVLAMYDVRVGVAASGGTVDSWNDVRSGTGFGPVLTSASGTRPAYDAVNLLITGNGTGARLTTSSDSRFATNLPKTLVFVGTVPNNTTGNDQFATFVGTSYSRSLSVITAGSGAAANQISNVSGAGSYVNSPVAGAAVRRIVISSEDTGVYSIEVPNTAKVTNGIGNDSAGNNVLSLFARENGDRACAATVRAVIVLNRAATVSDASTLKAWAQANHAAVLA
ncbi:MAG: hypothetical protein H0W30_07090 [Gemmatimonadaceae bacterium]|nr:hypothetical protein [Gemmatimonadaceae bacterium]